MHSSTFIYALPFLMAMSAAGSSISGFIDYYTNVYKRGVGQIEGLDYAIMLLTRGNGTTHRSRFRRYSSGDANITAASHGAEFLAEVAFGSQSFQLVIDTGSSDTWVPSSNVSCLNQHGEALPQSACAFGNFYTDVQALTPISGIQMNQTYLDGEFMEGPMYLQNVTIGGITIDQAQVSIVDHAFWTGDGVNSGLVGLGPPNSTSAFSTSTGDSVPYNPVLTTLFEQSTSIAPFFSIALDKVESGPAGYLAIGALPPVPHSDAFTTVPIEQPRGILTDYYINVTGFSIGGEATTDGGAEQTLQMIVDSGTTNNVVPTAVASKINALFTPEGKYNGTLGQFQVECNATAPAVNIQIGNGTFAIDAASQIFQTTDEGVCYSGWGDGGDPNHSSSQFFLGDVFLSNVVAVFDQSTLEMHFASRHFASRCQ